MNSGSVSRTGGHQDIPDLYLQRWQPLVNMLALYYDVPAAVITRANPDNIECIVSSVKDDNVYNAGFKCPTENHTYCDAVIRSQNELLIENALDDPQWKDSAGAKSGFVSYYGLPLFFPDGETFGAICVMDKKSRSFDALQKKILEEIKNIIELDLSGLSESVKSLFFDLIDKFSYIAEMMVSGSVEIMLFDRHGQIISDSIAEPIINGLRMIFSSGRTSFHELLLKEYGDLIQEKIKEVLKVDETVKFEMKLNIEGIEHIFLCNMGHFFGLYVVALVTDVTETKKMESAFIWSEKLKDLILSRMPVIVWSTDSDLDVRALYGQIISTKGYNPDMFMDKPLAKVLDDLPDREKIIDMHRKVLKGKPVHYEANLYGYDVSAHLEPLYDSDNSIVGTIGVAYDITPQKLAENYYHDIYDKYRLVMDAANEGFWEWDEKSGYVNTNPSFFRMLGYEPDEFRLSLKKLKKMIHPDESPEVLRNMWEVHAKPGSHYEREIRLRCKDGSWKWFMFRARSIAEGGNDGIKRVIGTYTDINARKVAEEKLRDSEKKYREIVETANESVVVFDSDLRITFANQLFAESTGFEEEELIKKSLYDFIPEEDMPYISSVIEERMKGKGGYTECRFKRKDDSLFWVFSTTRPRLDENGRFSGMLTMFVDITEKKKAEEALEQNIKTLNEIFETSNEAILSLDPEYRISYANEKVLDFSGYSSEEILNKPVSIFFYDEDLPSLNKLLKERRKGGLNYSELRVKIKDGSEKWMMVASKSRLDDEGNFAGMLAMVMDITKRKLAEEKLQKSEEKYRGVVERISDIIVVFDSNQELTFISPSIEKVLGYTPAEFRGIGLDRILDAGELKKMKENFRKAFRGVDLEPFEIQAKRKDGSIASIEANLRPIYMDERCTGVQAIAHDISERKEMEFELTAQKRLFSSLISHMPVGVFAKDVKSGHRYTIWNPEFENIAGIKAEDAIGKTDYELYGDKKGEDIYRDDARVLEIDDIIEQYKSITTESGLRHYYTLKFPGYDADGSISQIYGLIVDVTEQKDLEEGLKKSLEDRDLLIKELHHRVKNNLAIISGIISMQMGKGIPAVTEELKDLDGRIQSIAAVHESLYQSESFPRVSLKPHLVYLIQSIIASYPPGIPVTYDVITGDTSLKIELAMNLSMIINELVTNSMKHAFVGRERGHVSVTFGQEGDDCVLIVEDDGIGMPDIDLSEASGIGFRIINTIVKYWLKGNAELNTENGTRWTIRYPKSRKTK